LHQRYLLLGYVWTTRLADILAGLTVTATFSATTSSLGTEAASSLPSTVGVHSILDTSGIAIAFSTVRVLHIGPASRPESLINLSEIDFEALQAKFAQSHKRTEAEKLRRLIEGKLAQMLKVNGLHQGHPGREAGAGLRARLRPLLRRRTERLPARRDQLAAPGSPSTRVYTEIECKADKVPQEGVTLRPDLIPELIKALEGVQPCRPGHPGEGRAV
jgi:hypothetical protein